MNQKLNGEQKDFIKSWIISHNAQFPKTKVPKEKEALVYKIFEHMVHQPFDEWNEDNKKKSRPKLLAVNQALDNLSSFHKKIMQPEIEAMQSIINRELTNFEESGRYPNARSGEELAVIELLLHFDSLFDGKLEASDARNGAFDCFIALYYQLIDPHREQDSYETLIGQAYNEYQAQVSYYAQSYAEEFPDCELSKLAREEPERFGMTFFDVLFHQRNNMLHKTDYNIEICKFYDPYICKWIDAIEAKGFPPEGS